MPKITDFGLAKRLDGDSGKTRSGTVLGTPSYMAPEQAQGYSKAVGPAADVWALGAILYELLTGRPPFRAPTPMDTLFQLLQDEPVPPARLQPTCPRDLEIICLKCLQKEAHKRYASAEELADDLHRFLNGEPIRARPAGVWERSIKWARRHPAVAALVVVSTLTVLALAGAAVGHEVHLQMKVKEAKQALKDKESDVVRAESRPLLDQARAALNRKGLEHKDFATAVDPAREVLGLTRDEPSLAELKAEAEGLLKEVKRQRDVREKYLKLFPGRDKVLFQLNRQLITGLGGPESLTAVRQAAQDTLNLFQVASEGEGGPILNEGFSDSEKEKIILGCYHVLLIQADTLVWPWSFPGGGKKPGPADPEVVGRALRILERANKLVPFTKVYHLRRARYLTLLGEETEASRERELARRRQPAGPFDTFLVGLDRLQENPRNPQEALRHFEQALQDDQDLFWARLFLAVALKQGQRDRARAHLTICIKQSPDFVWCYLIRGFIAGEQFDFGPAEADFATAAQLNQRRPDRSAEYVLLVNRGVMRIRQHLYEEAIKDLKKAVDLLPGPFEGHLNLGVAYREQERRNETVRLLGTSLQPARLSSAVGVVVSGQDPRPWKAALAELDEAVTLQPRLAILYRERAQLHLLRRDLKSALKDFNRAIAAPEQGEPKTHEDYLDCGLIHYLERRYQEAISACDKALRLRPGYARAHRVRAEAILARADKEASRATKRRLYREALRSFDHYLLLGPPTVEVCQSRALAHAGLGNYAGVVGDYDLALAIRPRDPLLHAERGWAYLILNDHERAREDFTEAIRLDPTDGHSHNGLGYALVKLGKAIEGVREANKALQLGPPTRRLFYNAARVFAQAYAMEAEAEQTSRGPGSRSDAYREEALRCLVQALERREQERPAEFWQKVVGPDSRDRRDGALYPLRGSRRFVDLAQQYDPPAGGRLQ